MSKVLTILSVIFIFLSVIYGGSSLLSPNSVTVGAFLVFATLGFIVSYVNRVKKPKTKLESGDTHESTTTDPDTNKKVERSEWWYALPFVFGLVGGLIAYFMVKEDDKRMANQCVALGLVCTLIWGIILSFAWYVGFQSLIRGS